MPHSVRILASVLSVDPAVSSAKLAGQIERTQTGLRSAMQDLGVDKAEVSRALNFPLTGSEVAIEILIGIASGMGEVVGKRIGDRVLDWLRSQWPNSEIELIQLHLSDSSDRKD